MPKVRFTLDGKEVEAEAEWTILEAARRNGIVIPTLCHDDRLKPYGSCRICLVEVEGARGPLPACVTQVTSGMVVKTKTEDIVALRRMGLEAPALGSLWRLPSAMQAHLSGGHRYSGLYCLDR